MKVDRQVQDQLHAEVCAGDPAAWSRVFTTLLQPLIDWLGFRWDKWRDSERLHDFAIDSIMRYLQSPGRYDPTKCSLLTYLRMDAHGDLLNDYERRQRISDAEQPLEVELVDEQRNRVDDYPSDHAPPDLTLNEIRQAFPDERDRRAVLLFIAEEHSTDAFAAAWEINHLPGEERSAAVKRNKDRLKARIRRMKKSA